VLACSIDVWLDAALAYPGIKLFDLTPKIAVESTQLPPDFHRDPADQMIVATSRVYDLPLLTADSLILSYPHVKKAL
jgi:PIN domain nuclease of toxin-antitoxin system